VRNERVKTVVTFSRKQIFILIPILRVRYKNYVLVFSPAHQARYYCCCFNVIGIDKS